jgi:transcriptional regulatory protein LevR
MDNKVIHANYMSIVMSEVDCDLVFKTIIPDQDGTGKILGNIVAESINVFMSIQQAKSFLNILKQQVETYEETHGVIIDTQPGIMTRSAINDPKTGKDLETNI